MQSNKGSLYSDVIKFSDLYASDIGLFVSQCSRSFIHLPLTYLDGFVVRNEALDKSNSAYNNCVVKKIVNMDLSQHLNIPNLEGFMIHLRCISFVYNKYFLAPNENIKLLQRYH